MMLTKIVGEFAMTTLESSLDKNVQREFGFTQRACDLQMSTLNLTFSVTYYLNLHIVIYFYY